MNWYKQAKYYSTNRDDNEIRVVICPKCGKPDITKTDEMIALAYNNYPLKLCKCNKCKTYFAFYREDGMRDISKEEANEGIKNERLDVQIKGKERGMDNHGHSYYVAFTEKPKTVSKKEYEEKVDNSGYEDGDRWKKQNLIDLNSIIRNRDVISKIDFEKYQ